jgi:prepilin-type N-terminal cleavage/methylation domain-containing protein
VKTKQARPKKGFTLIEVIVTLVVLAIVAAMLAGFFGTSITESSAPVFRLQAAYSLNQTLEKITAFYNSQSSSQTQPPTWSGSTSYAKNDIVIPTVSNGYQYICTKEGTSGTTEPAWSTGNSAIDDNGIHWKNNGAAAAQTDIVVLQTQIGAFGGGENQDYTNKTFGGDPAAVSYHLVENRFIKFDAGSNAEVNINDTPTDPLYGKYLKVTIKLPADAANSTGETLSALFVSR